VGLLISFLIFPISSQPIFIFYLIALSGAVYLSGRPKSAIINLYLAFVLRWTIFISFSIISLLYIPENTLIAVFLLVYLNTTFNPKPTVS